ncbi:MAG: hypothetical protein IT327_12750 [Anaerolineae bacterium]|nr:hypothetical protein [Anaerolineae bacterium]
MPNPPTGLQNNPPPPDQTDEATTQLEQTAHHLAQQHQQITSANFPPHLLERLSTQEATIEAVHQYFVQASQEERDYSAAAEWILDNYYVVQQALRQVKRDLPSAYYKELPKLADGRAWHGLPRVFALARHFTIQENCYTDVHRFARFLQAYQQETPLKMGEVWALPIMLRFCLLECLAQTAVRVTRQTEASEQVAPMLQFSVTAADTDVIANAITGLRQLASYDWNTFFEESSQVEQILRQDPAGLYGRMTFHTRDQYRKVVEKLALATDQSELSVARAAIDLTQPAVTLPPAPDVDPWAGLAQPVAAHVGHYLLGDARDRLAAAIGHQPNPLRRWLKNNVTAVYPGSLIVLTILLLLALVLYTGWLGGAWWQMLLVGLLAFVPVTAVAVNIVNWLVTNLITPHVLPKLDFAEGIPATCRTMVVIPALLTSEAEAHSLFAQLEQHYLRNPDPQLGFALLTDFADAPEAQMPEDDNLVAQAREMLHGLNRKYAQRPFYLFHRHRLHNPSEGTWMGWERKRGKLHEFNQLLRGKSDTTFAVQEGDLAWLPQVKYVITLDADTVLPTDAACRLVGALAHPLNRAQCEPHSGRITTGYTILQPRTEVKPASAGQSLFTRVFAGDTGLDLYTLAVSDVYQDLFGEGIYVGKGIYDVDAFECSLANRIPDNTLLSHDLFEGVQGRAGLVTDIVLYEDYPPHYLVHVGRSHRWIRGDWQLLPWLFPLVPSPDGRRRNDLSFLARWKIVDNLRRSLVAPALFFFLVVGWFWLPGAPVVWSGIGILLTAVPMLTAVFMALQRGLGGANWHDIRRPIRDSVIRWLLEIAFLPYEALLHLDAIFITLWRIFVTRRHLLQWTTAAHTVRLLGENVSAEKTAGQMVRSLILVSLLLLLLATQMPTALSAAAPFLILWVFASEIAHRISLPEKVATAVLTPTERQRLRSLARRTWLFFEEFVGPEDNWLPPDHFQEAPRGVVAHRTSPTNVGLYLLTALAAYDLGYIGLLNLSLRLNDTLDTLDRLDRYRGHFLNWIDTRTLHPLPPRYVSTVDSGNLAGCLLALKQGCLSLKEQPIWQARRWQGLLDTLSLFNEAVATLVESERVTAVRQQLAHMQSAIEAARTDSSRWAALLDQLLETDLPELNRHLLAHLEAESATYPADVIQQWRLYLDHLYGNVEGMERELKLLTPWLLALHQTPAYFTDGSAPPEVQAAWQAVQQALPQRPRLSGLIGQCRAAEAALTQLLNALAAVDPSPETAAAAHWCTNLHTQLINVRLTAEPLLTSYDMLAQRAHNFAEAMDFTFLYNAQRNVFHIGYNLDSSRLDNNFYDLLASEARIASLVAIAKRDVPQKHWLHLARPLARLSGELALLSWSGTMFEYLMPPLLMHSYPNTLLAQSTQAVVEHQIAYGRTRNVPWGISESGFYTFDNAQNYQYRAFGVPGAGLKRGLSEDLVITPYAAFLALPTHPKAVLANLDHLLQYQMLGPYGLYEALDFTPSHLTLGQEAAVVRSYMSHHQGMLMLGLVNYLENDIMVSRFHAEPTIESVALLLQEQVPANAPLESPHEDETAGSASLNPPTISADPWPVPLDSSVPLVHYLSNGRFSSLITNAGSGYLTTPDVAYTRWRPDTTRDNWGQWLYVQDMPSGQYWSATQQPVNQTPQNQEVTFFPHKAQFRRRNQDITLQMEVTVAAEDDVEIRLVHLTNDSGQTRRLRLTSYGEVVLTDYESDRRHPAFAKLFVESEYVPAQNALFFRRRPRSHKEQPRFMAHMLVAPADVPLTRAYESDRAKFIGRRQTDATPDALAQPGRWLTGTTGATLDPVMALGQEVELAPHTAVELAWITFTAETRADLLALAREYQRWVVIRRAFTDARTQAEQDLRRLNLTVPELAQVQRLLALLLYPHTAVRADAATLLANTLGQSGLWGHGISGDYPILLLRVADENPGDLLPLLLRAHTYWRRRGLRVDLVLLNEQASNYGQMVQSNMFRAVHRLESEQWLNKRGGIFILRADQMNEADFTLLQTAARVVLRDSGDSLEAQLGSMATRPARLPAFQPTLSPQETGGFLAPLPRPTDLQFDNGWGGFSPDGAEYVVYLEPGMATPAPWINVIANEQFGFLVSETGGGYSWASNSGENRLTSWRNDPVSDVPAEALYLRDEETAEIWSPTPQPAPADAPYLVRHGAGYTVFAHHSHNLKQTLSLFVAPDAPVKFVQLRLENSASRPRRITATYYAEWVLGTERSGTQPFIIPAYRPAQHALLARNPYNTEFAEAVAFLAASKEPHGFSADRTEFLGRLGSLSQPAALGRIGLSNSAQVGTDPAAIIQLHLDLPPGGSETITFLLGEGQDEADALALIERFRQPDSVNAARQATADLWDDVLGTVTVDTPDPAMNLLLNRWLLYQALACRIWGRSALYQSSGAYGFRDQLQDVMAVLHARPDLAREHLLRSARHQFEAGDVLHWWHPPSGRGVRTRITDDLVWLPYVTAVYCQTTGDTAVLDELVPYLVGDPLGKEEEERYGQYQQTETAESLYQHCCRVLEHAATQGRHGLPLMGGGDWNDGMNRVGIHGQGESVWLGWFLAATLQAFAELCQERGDGERARQLREQARAYREAIETEAWDGDWYLRAFYDDGTPLGSQQNRECRIDAIAQSWAVLSGLGDSNRVRQAMTAVEQQLINEEQRLLLLFTPPFDQTRQDPGYIKGYLPGIRENGGQYTHAALWTIWAYAELGQTEKAEALFRLINPIYRADTPEKAAHYGVEPYVIAADVYGVAPHQGRGGWTWYTGSSGWMYRLGIEGILGLRRCGDMLQIKPQIPPSWPGFEVVYRYGRSTYHITVTNNPDSAPELWLDGQMLTSGREMPLVDDGRKHVVKLA